MDQVQKQNEPIVEFIHISINDTIKSVHKKIKPTIKEITYFDASEEVDYVERDLFWKIIDALIKSSIVTIIIEPQYIDATYTDAYYHHFAGLHLHPSKYCKRLSFYNRIISIQHFLTPNKHEELRSSLVGTMVIRPLRHGFIGRTLLNPHKLKDQDTKHSIYLRTAQFKQHILGIEFEISAFPFCSQDSCFMTCAEVTILNMMEYYTARYHAYKAVLPSDIKKMSQQYQYERVTPSAGLTYLVVSKILSEFGFAPRLYNIESIPIHPLVGDDRENEIKRIMHYYIESGIPVAVNVEPRKGELREGHSLLCIGHSDFRDEERAKNYAIADRQSTHDIINSADFYTHYCVIDDHLEPYAIRDYREMSKFDNMWISNLAVPLYKKMYLEATYAYDIFYEILRDRKIGLSSWEIPIEYLANDEAIVLRIYQASSRSYKAFKVNSYDSLKNSKQLDRKALWASLPLPQFIWCCEFFSYHEYTGTEPYAFAVIILDATALLKNNNYADSMIAIETVSKFIQRENGWPYKAIMGNNLEQNSKIPIYTKNLEKTLNFYS